MKSVFKFYVSLLHKKNKHGHSLRLLSLDLVHPRTNNWGCNAIHCISYSQPVTQYVHLQRREKKCGRGEGERCSHVNLCVCVCVCVCVCLCAWMHVYTCINVCVCVCVLYPSLTTCSWTVCVSPSDCLFRFEDRGVERDSDNTWCCCNCH